MRYNFNKKDCPNLIDFFLQKYYRQIRRNNVDTDSLADEMELHIGPLYAGSFLMENCKYKIITATEEMLENLKDEALVEYFLLRQKGQTI